MAVFLENRFYHKHQESINILSLRNQSCLVYTVITPKAHSRHTQTTNEHVTLSLLNL